MATLNLTVKSECYFNHRFDDLWKMIYPIHVNSLIFNAAISQAATLVVGCDSVATLNLTVNPNVTSTTDLTICENDLPYSWNGLTFNAAGSQAATLVSAAGCDSVATLNLTVNPNVTSTTDLTICENDLPYSWNSLIFNAAGSQAATLVSAAGCDSVATLNLTVNPNVTSTTDLTICGNDLPYSWNSLIFNAAGSQAATLVSAAGCDSDGNFESDRQSECYFNHRFDDL